MATPLRADQRFGTLCMGVGEIVRARNQALPPRLDQRAVCHALLPPLAIGTLLARMSEPNKARSSRIGDLLAYETRCRREQHPDDSNPSTHPRSVGALHSIEVRNHHRRFAALTDHESGVFRGIRAFDTWQSSNRAGLPRTSLETGNSSQRPDRAHPRRESGKPSHPLQFRRAHQQNRAGSALMKRVPAF